MLKTSVIRRTGNPYKTIFVYQICKKLKKLGSCEVYHISRNFDNHIAGIELENFDNVVL